MDDKEWRERLDVLEKLFLAASPTMYEGRGMTSAEIRTEVNKMRQRHGLAPLDPPKEWKF